MSERRVAVVGTGFAAWGAVVALTRDSSISVKIFDIGLTHGQTPEADRTVPNAKECGGSFFCYGINDPKMPWKLNSERMCSSHAYGGHSVVFSGAVLYPKDIDMAEWPRGSLPRAEDYQAILNRLPVVAVLDELEACFPRIPTQKALSADEGYTSALGLSRVAAEPNAAKLGNEAHLQPYSLTSVFDQLREDRSVTYQGSCYVSSMKSEGDRVTVCFFVDGIQQTELFDAVFVGAGCVNTTAIIDRSFFRRDCREYAILSPPGAIHAFLRLNWRTSHEQRRRQLNGLPEYFLEVRSPLTGGAWSHTQLTAINKQIIDAICARLPKFFHPLVHILRRYIYFALSSQKSGKDPAAILCVAGDDHESGKEVVVIREFSGRRMPKLVRAVRYAVLQNWQQLGMLPIPFGQALADFFRRNRLGGWHFGGTLPMREEPTQSNECRANGEVANLPGVFVVDSSAFPSIPSSTIALLTAAHAHRVARTWLTRTKCREA